MCNEMSRSRELSRRLRRRTRVCSIRVDALYQICLLQLWVFQVNSAQQQTTNENRNFTPLNNLIDTTTATIDRSLPPTIPKHQHQQHTTSATTTSEKRAFVIELLRMLHEQYGGPTGTSPTSTTKPSSTTTTTTTSDNQSIRTIENRQSTSAQLSNGGMMAQLIEAIGADGDVRRLIDWIRNSFNLASVGELTTQFVVSKLGSVNCAAMLQPNKEESLIPRFLLFNEHFVDVPFELSINPNANECILNGKFDPQRRTIILIHGYLAGYTLVDGITNIKNRILDLNKYSNEQAMGAFLKASQNNGSYVLTDDLQMKVRQQLYNVVIVDWFNGANPVPRANYIRAAVNAQVVGRLIARFLSALIVQCGTPASNLQIIAHSLGCHVSGFTGKALNLAGHRLGKITHLDPIGLCFGRLFSQPQLRLRPNDALETQAVHVSLNIFDNPLDGVHSNFLVNGGRDQIGCGGQSELQNSTTSSVSLLFDPGAKFAPCSHLRALALFEEDLSSGEASGQCQMVGYRCSSYERFLAGKCGLCDASNSQCRLMSLPPLSMQFRKLTFNNSAISAAATSQYRYMNSHLPPRVSASVNLNTLEPYNLLQPAASVIDINNNNNLELLNYNRNVSIRSPEPHYSIGSADESTGSTDFDDELADSSQQIMFGAPSHYLLEQQRQQREKQKHPISRNNEIKRRSERRLDPQGKRLVQVIGRIRQDTRTALAESWTNLRSLAGTTTTTGKTKSNSIDENEDLQQQASSASLLTGDPEADAEPTTIASTMTTAFVGSTLSSSPAATTSQVPDTSTNPLGRLHEDFVDQIPLGGQAIPPGSLNGPLFFLGTSSLSPYCVNYYQFRVLIAESRLQRILKNNGLASNRLAPPISHQSLSSSAVSWQQRMSSGGARELLHLTIKLSDTSSHFFKGFSMIENAKSLPRVANDIINLSSSLSGNKPIPPLPVPFAPIAASEPLAELTMLLNTTRTEPVKIGETIISYYFHPIVLADRIEINYMSNISPEIRDKYSSVLCPVAINDRHQLVRYIECHKV